MCAALCQVVFRDPLVKLVQATLPLPVPFVDRLKALCGPYWRFLVTPDNVEQVGGGCPLWDVCNCVGH